MSHLNEVMNNLDRLPPEIHIILLLFLYKTTYSYIEAADATWLLTGTKKFKSGSTLKSLKKRLLSSNDVNSVIEPGVRPSFFFS